MTIGKSFARIASWWRTCAWNTSPNSCPNTSTRSSTSTISCFSKFWRAMRAFRTLLLSKAKMTYTRRRGKRIWTTWCKCGANVCQISANQYRLGKICWRIETTFSENCRTKFNERQSLAWISSMLRRKCCMHKTRSLSTQMEIRSRIRIRRNYQPLKWPSSTSSNWLTQSMRFGIILNWLRFQENMAFRTCRKIIWQRFRNFWSLIIVGVTFWSKSGSSFCTKILNCKWISVRMKLSEITVWNIWVSKRKTGNIILGCRPNSLESWANSTWLRAT